MHGRGFECCLTISAGRVFGAVAVLILSGCVANVERLPGGGDEASPTAEIEARDFSSPAGRPMTIEDYYRIKAIRAPQISPDGRWVAYTVSTPIEETNEDRDEVWAVPTETGDARHVLHDGAEVSSPGWTDTGRLRYWAEGGWSLDLDDPAARPVRLPSTGDGPEAGAPGGTPAPFGGADRPIPSPDGAWTARLEEVPVAAAEPVYGSDFERRHEERFEGRQFDWMYFQRDGREYPVADPRAQPAREIVIAAADGGSEPRRITELGMRPGGLVWHPDGSLLLFTADAHFRDEMSYGRPDLWTVTLDGEVRRLTDDGYTYGGIGISPDGRFISYVRGFGTDMIIDEQLDHGGSRDLFIQAVEGGEPINLTADWDLDPGSPRWAPEGGHLYFTAGIGGSTHLFRVAASGGGVEQVTAGERRLGNLTIDRDFRKIAYTVGRIEAFSELYVADIDGSGERRLTSVNDPLLDEIAFSEAEHLRFRSYDGTPIEGWLLYPYGYSAALGPYPMIVNSHGGPHSASGYRFNPKHQYFAANGYFVLETNFRSSTGYGDDFKWATWGAWGDKDGEDVMSGVDYAIANFSIDPDRVGVTGHSYGGFMSNWLITQYPDRIAAAVVGAGISNWISDYGTADIARTKETEFFGTPWEEEGRQRLIRQSPLTYADRVTAPTLFIHGEVDQRVPYEEAEQMYFAIKKQGVPAKMIQYAGMAHGIRGHWNIVHRAINELAWWDRWLAPQAPETNGGG